MFAEATIFVAKKMNHSKIMTVLQDDHLLEQFGEMLIEEINEDDESLVNVARKLLQLCLQNEQADDFFIAICGWSVDSLLNRIGL